MSKYCGLYKGTVVNNQDPTGQMRIIARVAQLFGPTGQTGWALPCYPLAMVAPPQMGDPVWIMFESGDEDHPVYMGAWSKWDTQIAEATVADLPSDLSTINSEITAINNGTSGLPATTVTGPDAFGDAAVIGTSIKYARADHHHGLPAAPLPGQELAYVEMGTADFTFVTDNAVHNVTGMSITFIAPPKFIVESNMIAKTNNAAGQVNFQLFKGATNWGYKQGTYDAVTGFWVTQFNQWRIPFTGISGFTAGSSVTVQLSASCSQTPTTNTATVLGSTNTGSTGLGYMRAVAC